MEEVEFLCDRVAIMDHGKIIALGTREELRQVVGGKDVIRVKAANVGPEVAADLGKISQVEEATLKDDGVDVLSSQGRKVLSQVLSDLNKRDVKVSSVEVQEPDLESVFLHLTGRSLRD